MKYITTSWDNGHVHDLKLTDQVTATTLQAYPHSGFTYTKHFLNRARGKVLFAWLKNNCQANLTKLTEYYLNEVKINGGCFHSWEIEEYNLWNRFENIFKKISNRPEFSYIQNRV